VQFGMICSWFVRESGSRMIWVDRCPPQDNFTTLREMNNC
jgi:hypothetical protein